MADDEMEVFLQPPEYSSGGTVPGVPSDSVGLTIVSQPQPMMVPTPAVYKMDDLAPHNFMMLAVSVSVFCGFFHPTTLMCSIPAVILSVVVCRVKGKLRGEKGLYSSTVQLPSI